MGLMNYALKFITVTEKAAIESAKFNGGGDRKGADKAATEAMRQNMNNMDFQGTIVIGEGERDKAPMLFIGEKVGLGGAEYDIAVDPLEGTNLCAENLPGAICVMAIGPKGSLIGAPDTYMDKIVVGKEVSDEINLDNSIEKNLKLIAEGHKIKISEVNVIVMDRERHIDLIADIRELGAKVHLISDGDINAGISAALPYTKIHALIGIGAAPEGVIKAAAIKGLGGKMRARFKPQNDEVVERMKKMGFTDINKQYTQDDLAKGDELLFVATGVTTGDLLQGVTTVDNEIHTESIFICTKNKQISKIKTVHM